MKNRKNRDTSLFPRLLTRAVACFRSGNGCVPIVPRLGLIILCVSALQACSLFSLYPLPFTPHPDPQPGMVNIPPGKFYMGSKPTDGVVGLEIGVDELPQHRRRLPGFFIDRYEVTVDAYRAFVEATDVRPPQVWNDKDFRPPADDHPIIDVNWFEADAYCRWKGKRLPTETEWEKAARGTDGRIWPWGNQWEAGAANVQGDPRRWTAPVGSYSKDQSPYGLYDVAGNAMEWTSSWYLAYPKSQLERAAFGERYKVLKGGSWMSPIYPFSRAANRYAIEPKWDHPHVGFRCAMDP